MARAIDADALKKDLVENYGFFPALVMRAIDKQPTIEAEPVKRGKWVKLDGEWKSSETGEPLDVHHCSICGTCYIHAPYNHCPHCGAKMNVEKEEQA